MGKAKKVFQCQTCGKMFSFKTKLEEHAIIHTGEKPYSCSVCGKRFNRKWNMKAHKITHVPEDMLSAAGNIL